MRLLRRNLVSTYAAYAVSIVSGLVVTPILVHELGTDGYGLWAFIGAITTYLALLDLGVGPTIVRFGAEYRGRKDAEETNALASTGLVVYGLIGIVTALAGSALAWVVPLLIEVPDSLVGPARLASFLLVAAAAARFPLGLFGNVLIGQQRYDVVNAAVVVSTFAYIALVAGVLTRTGGIELLAGLTLATTLLRLALPLPWLRRELPFLRMRRSLVTRDRLRRILSVSSDNVLIHVAARVVFTSDVVVVGIVLGPEAAAYYAVPAKLFALTFALGTAGTNLLYPAFAEMEGADEAARQRIYLRSGLRGGMAAMLLFALPLILIPDRLIEAWIGEGFGQSTAVMVLLGGALLVHQPVHVVTQYLIARGLQRPIARLSIALVAVNLALSIVLAKWVALWGVALATLATEAVALALIPRLAATAAGVPLRALAAAWGRPIVPALVVAAPILVVLGRVFEPQDLLEFVPLGVLWTAACVVAVWRFGLTAGERAALGRRLRPAGAAEVAESY